MKSIIQYVAVAVFALLVGNATAATMLDFQDGSAGNQLSGWSHSVLWDPVIGQPDIMSFGGGGTSPLTIGADTAGEFSTYASVFSTTAFGNNMDDYNGTGDPVTGMQFTFSADSGAASGLGFYFQSAGGNVWYWDMLSEGGSGTYSVNFSSAGWYGYANNERGGSPLGAGDFTTDLGDVAAHGMYVMFNPNQAAQNYSISYFGLAGEELNEGLLIPEPETYMALGMALLGMAFVFRKRITDSLADARTMMQI